MSEKPDSLLNRMKRLPLWQWGLIFIFASLFVGLASTMAIDEADMRRTQERAARLGSACGSGLFMIAGIVLIVLHFVRRKPK